MQKIYICDIKEEEEEEGIPSSPKQMVYYWLQVYKLKVIGSVLMHKCL